MSVGLIIVLSVTFALSLLVFLYLGKMTIHWAIAFSIANSFAFWFFINNLNNFVISPIWLY